MTYGGKGTVRRSVYPLILLVVAVVATMASLLTVLRTFAMPVEARTTTPWYAYQSSVGFDFTAQVKQGLLYANTTVEPEALIKTQLPVDPPQYRRTLVTKHTESIEIEIPYMFKADRPADVTATLRVDGMLVVPNIWQKPITLVSQKQLQSDGTTISGTEIFSLNLTKLVADLEAVKLESNIQMEPLEIHIRPVLEVATAGLQESVNVLMDPEYLIIVHYSTTDIDDTRETRQEKTFAETTVVPISVDILGYPVKVAVLRQISLYSLSAFMLIAVVMVLLRRRKPDNRSLLQKLGPNLLTVRSFELPGHSAVVDVRSAKELVQLQAQSERPVIRAGSEYYLLDGVTCYRLVLDNDNEPVND